MNADAHLGPVAADEYSLTCTYSGASPTGALCGRPGTVHLLFQRSDGYQGGAPSCDEHGQAAIGGQWGVVDHHPTVGSACSLPAAVWVAGNPSRCVLDTTGTEPVPVLASAVPA